MTLTCPRCLDITRLASRANLRLSGVDRVERAYLKELLRRSDEVFGLVKTPFGFLLLDRTGLKIFDTLLETQTWEAPNAFVRLAYRKVPHRAQIDTSLRRLAIARARPRRFAEMLRSNLPNGCRYLNVGHSNLSYETLASFASVPNARIGVMIHDTIPLDHPNFQTKESQDRFQSILKATASLADVIIANSEATKHDVLHHIGAVDRSQDLVAAPLGVTTLPPPSDFDTESLGDYFLSLGTIEPRKNHMLLLNIWAKLVRDMQNPPKLVICGSRGWLNEDVHQRLDAKPENVVEISDASDGDVVALIKGSKALLMPSFAEGFGLPVIEAAALNTPILAADLPVYREFVRDIPQYLDPNDTLEWINAIKTLMVANKGAFTTNCSLPTWDQHFKKVLSRI